MLMGVMTDAEAERAVAREVLDSRANVPKWPDDAVDAAALVAVEAGELMGAALGLRSGTSSTERAQKAAVRTATMALRFLTGE